MNLRFRLAYTPFWLHASAWWRKQMKCICARRVLTSTITITTPRTVCTSRAWPEHGWPSSGVLQVFGCATVYCTLHLYCRQAGRDLHLRCTTEVATCRLKPEQQHAG